MLHLQLRTENNISLTIVNISQSDIFRIGILYPILDRMPIELKKRFPM